MTRPVETNDALKDAEPAVHVLSIAADRDHGEAGLDAASGCEFVDDRIRSLD